MRGVRRVHRGGSSGALPIVGVMSGTNRVDVAGAASIGSGGGKTGTRTRRRRRGSHGTRRKGFRGGTIRDIWTSAMAGTLAGGGAPEVRPAVCGEGGWGNC